MPFILTLGGFFTAVKIVKSYAEKHEFEEYWQGEDAGLEWSRMLCFRTILCILLALVVVCCATVSLGRFPEESIGANALRGIRWVALIYMAVMGVRLAVAWYRDRKRSEAAVVPAEPEPVFVSWMLEVPASSPSRADAERELPEYCARLLER